MSDPNDPPTDRNAGRVAAEAGRRLVAALEQARSATADWAAADRGQRLVDVALDECLATLAATGVVGRDNQPPSHELWRIAGPVLELGDLQRRARHKPRGYAGDFEMMTDFWEHRATDATPLGTLFDCYFLKQTAVEAVRARLDWAATLIAERCAAAANIAEFRVTSIGSGPGIDLFEAARRSSPDARSRMRLTLVDFDEAALDAATSRLASILPTEKVVVRRENLFRIATLRRAAALCADADFILCTGLTDYLADEVATAQLRLFWNGLRPGGLAMVGNFAPHNPSRPYMEWIGNWYLIYRTADDLARLAAAAGIPTTAYRVEPDGTGCDLFLLAEKSTA